VKKFGLPKESLLRKPYEYSRVYRKGNRLKGKGFSLIFLANDLSHSRLGISVHRLIRGAVHRNRIKRIVREVYRLHFDLFPKSCDIVFTVAPGFSLLKADAVREAVAGLEER
jgi:ribonuclease P protein component